MCLCICMAKMTSIYTNLVDPFSAYTRNQSKDPVRTLSHFHRPETEPPWVLYPVCFPCSTLVLLLICGMPGFPTMPGFPVSAPGTQWPLVSDQSPPRSRWKQGKDLRLEQHRQDGPGPFTELGFCVWLCPFQLVLRCRLQFYRPIIYHKASRDSRCPGRKHLEWIQQRGVSNYTLWEKG